MPLSETQLIDELKRKGGSSQLAIKIISETYGVTKTEIHDMLHKLYIEGVIDGRGIPNQKKLVERNATRYSINPSPQVDLPNPTIRSSTIPKTPSDPKIKLKKAKEPKRTAIDYKVLDDHLKELGRSKDTIMIIAERMGITEIQVNKAINNSGLYRKYKIQNSTMKESVENLEEKITDKTPETAPKEKAQIHMDLCGRVHEIYQSLGDDCKSMIEDLNEYGVVAPVIRMNTKFKRLKALSKNPDSDSGIRALLISIASDCIITASELSGN